MMRTPQFAFAAEKDGQRGGGNTQQGREHKSRLPGKDGYAEDAYKLRPAKEEPVHHHGIGVQHLRKRTA